ncbi:hypothetical protein EJB05_24213, partial [Eragrostis curvula]
MAEPDVCVEYRVFIEVESYKRTDLKAYCKGRKWDTEKEGTCCPGFLITTCCYGYGAAGCHNGFIPACRYNNMKAVWKHI